MLLRAQIQNVQVTILLFRVQYNVKKQVFSPDSTASQGFGAMTGTVAIAAFRESHESAWSTILPPRYASYLQQTQSELSYVVKYIVGGTHAARSKCPWPQSAVNSTFVSPVALHSLTILTISASACVGSGAGTMPSVLANSTPAAKQSNWLTATASIKPSS